MAQEFASDNSKTGLFSRLKLSNHRGFFSFLFVTLSIIFILVTFSAIQQQQTTQSKAAVDLCTKVKCSDISKNSNWSITCERNTCCKVQSTPPACVNDTTKHLYCSGQSQSLCSAYSASCEWKNNECIEKQPVQTFGQACNVATSNCYGVLRCINGKCDYPTVGVGDRCKNDRGDIVAKCQDGLNCSNIDAGTCVRIGGGTGTTGTGTTGTGTTGTGTTGTGTTGTGGGDSACTSISGRCLTGQTGREGKDCKAVAGQAGTGKIQGGNLCTGAPDRQCCVPNSSTNGGTGTKVTCGDITTQEACLPADQCIWNTKRGTTDTKICQRVCGRIPDQPTCDKRNDCNWKNNVCVTKADGGGDGATGSVDLNLKLSFQGIVTLPKTKTELKVKVRLVDVENREKENDASTFTADANGIWSGKVSFENVDLSQKYYLLIKGPMHVQKKICKADAADPNPGYYSCQFGNITLNSGSNDFDFSKVKMLVGDLDQNGIVDREDTSIVLNALLLPVDQRQSADTLEKADLNLDGIVSTQDWSLMLEALKIKYDEK